MLMEGALSRIAKAGANIKRREIALKGENISWAISIIEGLRSSLDHSHGGEIAGNLERLYDYMIRRLLEANLHSDLDKLGEAHRLMREIKAGWDGIGDLQAVAVTPWSGAASQSVAVSGQ